MKRLIFAMLALGFSATLSATTFEQANKYLITFMGKGLLYFWDLGVAEVFADKMEQQGKHPELYYAGNSSGALVAAYYGCYGLDKTTVTAGTKVGTLGEPEKLGMPPEARFAKFLLGLDTKVEYEAIRDLVNHVVYRDGVGCPLDKPLLIGATKGKMLESIEMVPAFLPGRTRPSLSTTHKKIRYDESTRTVYRLADEVELGKPCIHFVTKSMEKILLQLPESERSCDIVVMKKPEDLEIAIYASIAEPSLFPVFDAKQWKKLRDANIAKPGNRPVPSDEKGLADELLADGNFFVGGFATPVLGCRELKLADPEIYTIGTGLAGLPKEINEALSNWYSLDGNDIMIKAKKYLDLEVWYPNFEKYFGNDIWWNTQEKIRKGIQAGRVRSRECFDSPSKCPALPLQQKSALDAFLNAATKSR